MSDGSGFEKIDLDKYELFIKNLYGAINKDIDLPEGMLINLEGSIGLFGRIKAFVHSNDYDTHFHVQDIANGINARFDYPIIKLRNYTKDSRKSFSSKQVKRIVTTCNNEYYFEWIRAELSKRSE